VLVVYVKLPVSPTFPLASIISPSISVTIPVGMMFRVDAGATVTVKITGLPNTDGLLLLLRTVTLGTPFTVCVPVAVDPVKFTFPGHVAEIA
jgi:hypothetical protein